MHKTKRELTDLMIPAQNVFCYAKPDPIYYCDRCKCNYIPRDQRDLKHIKVVYFGCLSWKTKTENYYFLRLEIFPNFVIFYILFKQILFKIMSRL